MFTGIISTIGIIESAEQRGDLRLTVACGWPYHSLYKGESIAVNGACLTVIERIKRPKRECAFTVDISAETLACTAPRWQPGQRVNLERALLAGDALDGHIVTGHVDGIATITNIEPSGDSHIFTLEAPSTLARFIAAKGSVTLDGVSLTVNKVEGNRFWVNIIPHTLGATTLGERKPKDPINLEIDIIARYVERLLAK